jgi:hypothetical protein
MYGKILSGKTIRESARVLAMASLLFLVPALARAQFDVGVRGGFYSDASAGFLGAELLTPLPIARGWFLNPNFEYVFVDDGHLYTLNLDAHYDLNTRNEPYYFWLGGGPAIVFSKLDGSDSQTDLGLNLLAGIGFWKRSAVRPYVQGKVTISDNTEASIGFGVRFH